MGGVFELGVVPEPPGTKISSAEEIAGEIVSRYGFLSSWAPRGSGKLKEL